MLEIKKSVAEIKNVLDSFSSRLDTAEERIFELENMIIETFKTKKQREKKTGNKKRLHRGIKIKFISKFQTTSMQARREWSEIFKMLKEQNHRPRNPCLTKVSFKGKDYQIKTFQIHKN